MELAIVTSLPDGRQVRARLRGPLIREVIDLERGCSVTNSIAREDVEAIQSAAQIMRRMKEQAEDVEAIEEAKAESGPFVTIEDVRGR